MRDYKAIEAAIAGAAEQRRLVGRELAAWEIAAMRKQLTYQLENASRRLVKMRASRAA